VLERHCGRRLSSRSRRKGGGFDYLYRVLLQVALRKREKVALHKRGIRTTM
jgi:hypothetical protein